MSRLPCEMYDKVNYMCRKYMDRMARFELVYDFRIDEKAFKATADGFLKKAPVFRSVVVKNPITPYWKTADYCIEDMISVSEPDDIEAARKKFFLQEIPLDSNVQIKIALFYSGNKTYVSFIWNHMGMDGGGFKQFWLDFCRNYTAYVDEGIAPTDFADGVRGYKEIYNDFDKKMRRKAKSQFTNGSPKDNHKFPFTPESEKDSKVLVVKTVEPEFFEKARLFCKQTGATVNDMLLAAYMQAFGKMTKMKPEESLSVSCATDLRRHMKDFNRIGYTNHVSFSQCYVENKGESVLETLDAVVKSMDKIKKDPFMGLHGLPLLNIAYKTMIYAQAEPIVKLFYRNPTLSVSNVGNIDVKGFSLCGNEPVGAFVAGAAKNKPCAVMTALTINGRLSVSMCLNGNEEDEKLIKRFFDEFEKAIVELASL